MESLVTEIAGEVSAEAKVGIAQVLESKLGGKNLSKWISTVKLPDTSLPGMFARYQREAIKRGEVALGLEELDIELNQVRQFDSAVRNLEKTFGLVLEEATVETHRATLKQKAAEKMLTKLEAASGWVLLEGKFNIQLVDAVYRCTYHHPLNEFVPEDTGPITISFAMAADQLEMRYANNYSQSVGRSIPLRVFGKVWQPISRMDGAWDLEITPLAVY
jgi:hypothetical protein